MSSLIRSLSIGILILLPLGGPLTAQEFDARPGVAVLPFEPVAVGVGVPEDLTFDHWSTGLQMRLNYELGRYESIRTVERNQLQRAIDELELQQSDLADPATVGELGRLVGVRWMIVVSPSIWSWPELELVPRVFNVETGEYLDRRPEIATGSAEAVVATVVELADNLASVLDLPPLPTPVQDARESRVETHRGADHDEAWRLYTQAETAAYVGETEEAIQLLTRVLDEFPDYEPSPAGKLEQLRGGAP